MNSANRRIWVATAILSICISKGALAAPATTPGKTGATEPNTAELRQLTADLKRLEPVIQRLEKMRGLVAIAHDASPTLEKLDKLLIKADLVEKTNALVARIERLEPTLNSLDEMQREFAQRRRKKAGATAPVGIENWGEVLDRLQARLDALEKRVYAPPALADPTQRRTPIELQIKTLQERQQALEKEVQTLRKENERLRREQRRAAELTPPDR